MELTTAQMKVLQEIAARESGRPEAYYTLSGMRGKTLSTLLRAGLIERRHFKDENSEMYRLCATKAGKEVAAIHMRRSTP